MLAIRFVLELRDALAKALAVRARPGHELFLLLERRAASRA